MPDLTLPEIRLHYEIEGAGPPLLLIAGMASDGASWAPLMPLLSEHFTLIRPDNRTTGRTTPWNAPASVPQMAMDCAALLDHLNLARVHVMGHSLGGMIALHLAQSGPQRIASLTLAASAPIRLARNIALFETLVRIRQSDAEPDTWLRALFPWLFAPTLYDTPEAIDAAAAASLAYPHAQSTDAMAHQLEALRNYIPNCSVPEVAAQALLGETDLMLPTALAQTALDGTPTHIVQAAGHSIHWDAPQAVADHLRRFTSANAI